MILFEYHIGEPYWENSNNFDEVITAMNYCDTSFPLGIIECEIIYDEPENQIRPLLSHKTKMDDYDIIRDSSRHQ